MSRKLLSLSLKIAWQPDIFNRKLRRLALPLNEHLSDIEVYLLHLLQIFLN